MELSRDELSEVYRGTNKVAHLDALLKLKNELVLLRAIKINYFDVIL